MRLKGIKLITFDVTNTLLKLRVPPWQRYREVARDYGFRVTDDQLERRFQDEYRRMCNEYPNFGRESNMTWEEWWREIVRGTLTVPIAGEVDTIATQLTNEYRTAKPWRCAEGTEQLLKVLKGKNILIGVISNFDPRLHEILHNIKLRQYFDFVLTSYETGFCKPDVRIFDGALKECGNTLVPSDCLHIGDDLIKDYYGALAAGWHALLLNKEPPTAELTPKHIIPSLNHLTTAILSNKLIL